MQVVSKDRPKWFQFRWKLSNAIVKVARWVYPQSPETTAFFVQQFTDQMIYGQHIIRVNPEDLDTQEGRV